MNTSITVSFVEVLLVVFCWATTEALADEKPGKGKPDVQAILREASALAREQGANESYWIKRTLLEIGAVQVRAGDFDGALKSISASSYDYGRKGGLIELAEAIARNGDRERAFRVLALVTDHGWRQDYMDDQVQLQWVEYLIAAGKIDRARGAVKQLKSERYRPDGERKLAVGCFRIGDAVQAAAHFDASISGPESKDDFDRARAFWETAEAQLACGMADAAKATVRRLADKVELRDPWAKVNALTESAVIMARAKDERSARDLFVRAAAAQAGVNGLNISGALQLIANGQARAGFFEDALKSASAIRDVSRRDDGLHEVALMQLTSGDVMGAQATADQIQVYRQYQELVLARVADYHAAGRDFKAALVAAERLKQPSQRAATMLRVATAQARSGDLKAAEEIAGRVRTTARDDALPPVGAGKGFEFARPDSWGVCDLGMSFTMASYHASLDRAAEVAATAMTLAQILKRKPTKSYAGSFERFEPNPVLRSAARAHAASGDPNEALTWAREIGSAGAPVRGDSDARRALERRIYALVGVAEGVLDRPK
jgi:hypothetical protein